uniref:Uncharacterized protein n=1 Tax=Arundo donax TaxID=35708 RepID=A0A0A9BFM8_ARUDO
MLHCGTLHEAANEPHREGKVRPCVNQVPKVANKPTVLCCVDLSRGAVVTELEAFLHRRMRGIDVPHLGHVEDARHVAALAQSDPFASLVHLDPQIGEEPKIAHEELSLHFALESVNLRLI